MKHILTRFTMVVIAYAIMCPYIMYANIFLDMEDCPKVTDVTDSGCISRTRASSSRSLVMTKEGDIVTCEINGIVANCGVDYFDVQTEYAQGTDAPDTLFFNISPIVPSDMDCTCPYNVSFTIRNMKADNLFLNCWLYTGMVSFEKSNQVTMNFSSELVTIGNMQYYLYKPGQQAKLYKITEAKGKVKIPSTISYEGLDYFVGAFDSDFFRGEEVTKLTLPNTIFRAGGDREFYNCLNGNFPKLETIEVEPNSHLLSSVDGVLYSSDHKTLYCLPGANKRTEYTVIDGVVKIGRYAFALCPNLKSIRLPKSVNTIGPYAFGSSKNLESIYIPRSLNRDHLYEAFFYMSTATLYVPDEEVDYYKSIYKGPVLPISSSEDTFGISDVNQNTSKQVEHYDLQGRRLNGKPGKGVYIQNGQKMVVR